MDSTLIVYISNFFLALFDIFICMSFFNILLGKRKKSIPLSLFFISYILMELPAVLYLQYSSDKTSSHLPVILCALIYIIMLFAISFEYTAATRHRILTILSYLVIIVVTEAFHSILQTDTTDSATFFVSALCKLIMFLLVIIISLLYNNKREEINFKYSFRVLYIPTTSLFILYLTWQPPFTADTIENTYIKILISLSLIFICLTNYNLLNLEIQNRNLKIEQTVLEKQNYLQKKQYAQTLSSYKELRSVVHDTKKHLLYIRECATKKEYDKIINYTNENIEDLATSRMQINTGNLAIDALLSKAIQMASDLGCETNSHIQIDASLIPLSDHDLCIVLGNMTDNAINALSHISRGEKAYLNIDIFMTESQFVITIINATNPAEVKDYSPSIINTASKNSIHGYGLINVFNTVTKYNGLANFKQESNYFNASVIIPLEASMEV